MAWGQDRKRSYVPNPNVLEKRARRIEREFVKRHGMSSMKHLELVLAGKNEVLPDCNCYTCAKARFVPQKAHWKFANEN